MNKKVFMCLVIALSVAQLIACSTGEAEISNSSEEPVDEKFDSEPSEISEEPALDYENRESVYEKIYGCIPHEEFIDEVVRDVIANLDEEERVTILKYNEDAFFSHFDLGLFIRNKYIYGKSERGFYPYDPDELSSIIVDRIVKVLKESMTEKEQRIMEGLEIAKSADDYEKKGDAATAYQYRIKAALQYGDEKAYNDLGQMYMDGVYVKADGEKAVHYFERAEELGYAVSGKACVIIGTAYQIGDKKHEKNPKEAMKWFEMAADRGEDFGYACMGELYFKGEGVDQDYEKAYEMFVESGFYDTMPLYYLGLMYEKGLYVESDIKKAVYYYEWIVNDYKDCGDYGDTYYEQAQQRLSCLKDSR